MPLESVLFLVLVIGALAVFAAVLLYADWATRQVMRESTALPPQSAETENKPGTPAASVASLQKAA
jgi:hypothetical protein